MGKIKLHPENQLPWLLLSALKVPGGRWWVASYPLSSQAPAHVEVELGCDNIKYCKNLRPFWLSLVLGLMDAKVIYYIERGLASLVCLTTSWEACYQSVLTTWDGIITGQNRGLLETIRRSTLQMRLRIPRLTRQAGQNGQFLFQHLFHSKTGK